MCSEERRASRVQRNRHDGLVGGLVLITVGAIFLVERMHWGYGWGQLWPLFMIVVGLGNMFSRGHDGRLNIGGLWTIAVGVLFLLNQTRVMRMDVAWPLFIVGGGLALMFGGNSWRRARRDRRDSIGGSHE